MYLSLENSESGIEYETLGRETPAGFIDFDGSFLRGGITEVLTVVTDGTFGADIKNGFAEGGDGLSVEIGSGARSGKKEVDIAFGRANSYLVAIKCFKSVRRSTLKSFCSGEANSLSISLSKKNTTDSLSNFKETSVIV